MSTTQFVPQLRPLSVGEVLDASFKVVRQSFGVLALCVLVVAVPLEIISTLVAASTSDNAFNLDSAPANDISTGTAAAGQLLIGILGLVLTTLATAACFRAVSSTYLGEKPTVGESLSFAASRLLPLIWLSILYSFGLIIPFLLLLLPGIWLAVAWSLSYPALLAEDVRGFKALGRSFRLVSGRWWATFGALVVMFLIVVVISAIVGVLLGAILVASLDNEFVAGVLTTLINIGSSLITVPLFAAVLTIIYYDLRVRKEGFDLSVLARGVGTSAPTDAANVAASSGLGGYEGSAGGGYQSPGGGFAPPESGGGGGGFAPPQAPDSTPPPSQPPPGQGGAPSGAPDQAEPPPAPDQPPAPGEPSAPGQPPAEPPRSAPPSGPSPGGLQSGDPLAPPPERREGDGGTSS